MLLLFFCLIASRCLFSSESDNSFSKSISDSSIIGYSGSVVRVKYRQNDPYNIYRVYRGKRPIPSHTKEWFRDIIK